jgi:hypothetical protein
MMKGGQVSVSHHELSDLKLDAPTERDLRDQVSPVAPRANVKVEPAPTPQVVS